MDISSLLLQVSEWLGVLAMGMLVSTSPRFKHKQIMFRYPQREMIISFSLFALILLAAFIYYGIAVPRVVGSLTSIPRLLMAVVALLPFAAALTSRGQPLRSMGWDRQRMRPALLLGLGLGLLVLFIYGKVFSLVRGVSSAQALALIILLGISLAEESVFRGYLQLRLVSVLGRWAGILAAAALFTLWQVPLRLWLGQTGIPLLTALGLTLVQGLVLGYIAHSSGHVLASALYRTISEWIVFLG